MEALQRRLRGGRGDGRRRDLRAPTSASPAPTSARVNARGMVSVARKDREIAPADIDRVLEAAQSAALPSDREILHAVPQEFIVDEQGGISDPLGMLGSRLEVTVHLVTGNIARNKTLLTCVNRAGIEVAEMVFEPLATAEAVLTHDERELGALLIDIGAGTTGCAAVRRRRDPALRRCCRSAPATSPTTSRWCCARRSPRPRRSRLKHGCCLRVDGHRRGGHLGADRRRRRLARRAAARALRDPAAARRGDASAWSARIWRKNGWDEPLRGGVVLTGGGAQLDGLLELAEQVFDASVRYGLPQRAGRPGRRHQLARPGPRRPASCSTASAAEQSRRSAPAAERGWIPHAQRRWAACAERRSRTCCEPQRYDPERGYDHDPVRRRETPKPARPAARRRPSCPPRSR